MRREFVVLLIVMVISGPIIPIRQSLVFHDAFLRLDRPPVLAPIVIDLPIVTIIRPDKAVRLSNPQPIPDDAVGTLDPIRPRRNELVKMGEVLIKIGQALQGLSIEEARKVLRAVTVLA